MRPRWLVVGLVVSLAINLFLIGAGAGVVALGARMARQGAPSLGAGALFWATGALPQPDRRQMRQMLRDTRNAVQADANRSIALRTAAWGGLSAANPDAAAINQQLAASRQIDIGVRTRVEQKIVDYVARLPAADRAIFAAGMRRVLINHAPPDGSPPAPPGRAPAPAAKAEADRTGGQ